MNIFRKLFGVRQVLNKLFGNKSNKGGIRKGTTGVTVLVFIIIVFFLWWFFLTCHGWMVLAFPTFEVFPRWAFVLLLFLICSGGGGNSK